MKVLVSNPQKKNASELKIKLKEETSMEIQLPRLTGLSDTRLD